MPVSSVTIVGLDKLVNLTNTLPTAFNNLFHQAGKVYTQEVFNESQKKVPVKTGRLKRSGGVSSTATTENVHYDAPYATLIEKGNSRMIGRPFVSLPAHQKMPQFFKMLDAAVTNYISNSLK